MSAAVLRQELQGQSALNDPNAKLAEAAAAHEALEAAQIQIASVRNQYVWQYVRETLVERIASAPPLAVEPPPPPADDLVQAASDQVAHRHEALGAVLQSMQGSYAEVAAKREALQAKLEKMAALEAAAASWAPEEREAAAGAEDVVGALENEVAELEARLAARAADRASIEAHASEVKESTAALDAEASRLDTEIALERDEFRANDGGGDESEDEATDEHSVALKAATLEAETSDYKTAQSWFEAMARNLEALGGAKLLSCDEVAPGEEGAANGGLQVRIQLWGQHELTLELAPAAEGAGGGLVVRSAALPKATGVSIADLVPLAQTLPPGKDVRLLVREAATRVAAAPERAEHLATLRKRMTIHQSDDMAQLTVTLGYGVICVVRLAPDYPRSSRSAVIESVCGVGGWSDADLAELRKEMNMSDLNLIEIFETLEAKLKPIDDQKYR